MDCRLAEQKGKNAMEYKTVTGRGEMICHCVRLRRGEDLLEAIRALCRQEDIRSGVVLSAVGCVSRARIRDASGVNIREVPEHCEIVSLNGTVSARRCHLHIALSREDLTTLGGHLCPGTIVNTTCELVIGILPEIAYDLEEDQETGYKEIIFTKNGKRTC